VTSSQQRPLTPNLNQSARERGGSARHQHQDVEATGRRARAQNTLANTPQHGHFIDGKPTTIPFPSPPQKRAAALEAVVLVRKSYPADYLAGKVWIEQDENAGHKFVLLVENLRCHQWDVSAWRDAIHCGDEIQIEFATSTGDRVSHGMRIQDKATMERLYRLLSDLKKGSTVAAWASQKDSTRPEQVVGVKQPAATVAIEHEEQSVGAAAIEQTLTEAAHTSAPTEVAQTASDSTVATAADDSHFRKAKVQLERLARKPKVRQMIAKAVQEIVQAIPQDVEHGLSPDQVLKIGQKIVAEMFLEKNESFRAVPDQARHDLLEYLTELVFPSRIRYSAQEILAMRPAGSRKSHHGRDFPFISQSKSSSDANRGDTSKGVTVHAQQSRSKGQEMTRTESPGAGVVSVANSVLNVPSESLPAPVLAVQCTEVDFSRSSVPARAEESNAAQEAKMMQDHGREPSKASSTGTKPSTGLKGSRWASGPTADYPKAGALWDLQLLVETEVTSPLTMSSQSHAVTAGNLRKKNVAPDRLSDGGGTPPAVAQSRPRSEARNNKSKQGGLADSYHNACGPGNRN
jgi:hypothetical protein